MQGFSLVGEYMLGAYEGSCGRRRTAAVTGERGGEGLKVTH